MAPTKLTVSAFLIFGLTAIRTTSAATVVSRCDADNCLRYLRADSNYWSAITFCRSYLGTTTRHIVTPVPTTTVVTATRTVFAVQTITSGTTKINYITRNLAPYIAPNKRDVIPGGPVEAAVPEVEAPMRLGKRAPLNPSSACPGSPNRVSSACTCFIGETAEQSTVTRTNTQNTFTPTATVCTATERSQLRDRGSFKDWYATLLPVEQPGADIQKCCNICYRTPDCSLWWVGDYNDLEDTLCRIGVTQNSTTPNRGTTCPNGLLDVYDPYSAYRDAGPFDLGLCAFLTYSDE
ncbi:hypothetical protein DRE_06486 [Drechslerella stenobrocha 248]|uniref:Apple domain-containing protein n=1 Tax=Drechslerella stenobrocha 248 TaxID=1043628 RepID=W7HXR1_9PEZI|nr:hypothetical protein DRE_06486 [Drechslerella stenobrocha 248]